MEKNEDFAAAYIEMLAMYSLIVIGRAADPAHSILAHVKFRTSPQLGPLAFSASWSELAERRCVDNVKAAAVAALDMMARRSAKENSLPDE